MFHIKSAPKYDQCHGCDFQVLCERLVCLLKHRDGDLMLNKEELYKLTGYKRPSDQITELHRRGFYRATLSKNETTVFLERAHFQAVCIGTKVSNDPKVRMPAVRQLRAA